jgi:hypothetical protein
MRVGMTGAASHTAMPDVFSAASSSFNADGSILLGKRHEGENEWLLAKSPAAHERERKPSQKLRLPHRVGLLVQDHTQ